jgi:tRNA-Thr(GGU) m(6)t(6)A37 methyltransferase TsaA
MKEPIVYVAIGHVQNEFDQPVAPDQIQSTESRIILDSALSDGLIGLTTGQHALVVFHLHRSKGFVLLQHPQGDTSRPERGVFALRSPQRPNPIGVTEVEIVSIHGNELCVRGLDALNGTPVLDIKPA